MSIKIRIQGELHYSKVIDLPPRTSMNLQDQEPMTLMIQEKENGTIKALTPESEKHEKIYKYTKMCQSRDLGLGKGYLI